mmetsp:Transcript_13480/g.38851  ORF Transcript_13480/g.38851 Transcript_13480/m.38851 type:complete len:225 (+) Transcript_13480:3621-4295(+)
MRMSATSQISYLLSRNTCNSKSCIGIMPADKAMPATTFTLRRPFSDVKPPMIRFRRLCRSKTGPLGVTTSTGTSSSTEFSTEAAERRSMPRLGPAPLFVKEPRCVDSRAPTFRLRASSFLMRSRRRRSSRNKDINRNVASTIPSKLHMMSTITTYSKVSDMFGSVRKANQMPMLHNSNIEAKIAMGRHQAHHKPSATPSQCQKRWLSLRTVLETFFRMLRCSTR